MSKNVTHHKNVEAREPGRGLGALGQVLGTLVFNHFWFLGFVLPLSVAREAKRVFVDAPGTPSHLRLVQEDPEELGYTVEREEYRLILDRLGMTEEEAQAIFDRFCETFPAVKTHLTAPVRCKGGRRS